MKNNLIIFSLIALAILSALTGCKKDKKEFAPKDKEESPSIVGKWEGVSYLEQSFVDGQLVDTEQGIYKPGEALVEFKSNKTFIMQIRYLDNTDSESLSGTYTIIGNKIKMTIIEDVDSEFILTNNSNTLTLKTIYEETLNGTVEKDVSTSVFKRK